MSSGNLSFTVADGLFEPVGGYADTIQIYTTTAPATLTGLLYTDNNGQPGTLLAQSLSTSMPVTGWNTLTFTSTVAVNGNNTNYWIAFQINSNINGPAKDSVAYPRKFIASTYGTPPANSSSWTADGASRDSMYLTVCTGQGAYPPGAVW